MVNKLEILKRLVELSENKKTEELDKVLDGMSHTDLSEIASAFENLATCAKVRQSNSE